MDRGTGSGTCANRWRAGARALLLAFAVGAVGCGSDEDRFAEHLERAEAYVEAGQLEEALLEFRNALQRRPDSAQVNLRIAELLASVSEFQDATFFYREAQRLDATRTEPLLGEALIVMFSDPDRGEELTAKALAIAPDDPRVHAVRADLALVRGDTEQALEAALTSVELDPANPDWHMQLGIVEQARIREKQALGELVLDGMFDRAIRSFNRASELYERAGHWRPIYQRARVLAAWPEHADEAPAAFRRAADEAARSPEPRAEEQALRSILDQARASGDASLRLWAVERLTEVRPQNVSYWRELAHVQDAAGKPAEPVYELMLERVPEDVNAHLLYANARAAGGNVEAAIEHLRDARGKVKDPAVLQAGLLDLLRSVGRPAEADAAFADLEAEFPDHPHTRLARAQRDLREMRFEPAVEQLRTLANETEGTDALRLLAQAELGRGNPTAAVQAADRFLAQQQEGADELLSLKAQAQLQSGDNAGTLSTLRKLAREERPLTPRERLMSAQAHYRLGQESRARRVMAVLLQREDAPVEAYLVHARRESGRDAGRVRDALERALAARPDHEALSYEMVRIDLAEAKHADALARLDALAARRGALVPSLRLARAQVLASAGDEAAARAEALRAASEQPGLPGALALLGALYARGGEIQEAIDAVEAAGRDSLDATGLTILGRLHLQAGSRDDARALFEAALAKEPDLAATQNDLAYLLAEEGRELDRALELAKQAQEVLSEDPFAADTLGFVFLKRGLDQPAADQFRHAVELAEARETPRAEFQHHLGLALRRLGREAEAAEAFRSALAIDAEFAQAGEARRQLKAALLAEAEAKAEAEAEVDVEALLAPPS